jgi:hypothetical protein
MSHDQPTHDPMHGNQPLPAEADTARSAASAPGPQFEGDEINAGLLTVIGAFLAVTVFLIVVLLQAWFYNWKTDATTAGTVSASDPQTLFGRTVLEQQEQLNSYHWIRREANLRAIPIERAMQLVTAEMAAQQERPKQGDKP